MQLLIYKHYENKYYYEDACGANLKMAESAFNNGICALIEEETIKLKYGKFTFHKMVGVYTLLKDNLTKEEMIAKEIELYQEFIDMREDLRENYEKNI